MKYKVMIFSCGFFFPIFFLKEHKLPSMFGGRNLSGVKHIAISHWEGMREGMPFVCMVLQLSWCFEVDVTVVSLL